MKHFYYFIFCISLVCVIFISCTKSDSDDLSAYYIKGKKDGVAFKYSANTGASITSLFVDGDLFTSVSFNATPYANAANPEGLNVSIYFFNGATPATGMYTEENTTQDYSLYGLYNPNGSAIIKWSSGNVTTIKPLKVNILTKTATEMTGTFEGAFYKHDSSIPAFFDDYILFTECEFKLPIR